MRSYFGVAIIVLGVTGTAVAQRPGQTPVPTPVPVTAVAAVPCPAVSIAGPVRGHETGGNHSVHGPRGVQGWPGERAV